MIKRLLQQILLVSSLALLTACSSSPRVDNRDAAKSIPSSTTSPQAPTLSEKSKLLASVVGVTDGDTIPVLDQEKVSYRIRLQGIDAPEKRQAFGDVSRRTLASMVADKTVAVEWQKHDQYGRIVGKILLDGRDVCLEQIKAGLAWHYKQFEGEQSEADRSLYAEAERDARSQKVGLWRDSVQTPPWDFRHHGNSNSDDRGDSISDDAKPSPTSSNTTPTSSNNAGQISGLIRGNKNSMIYHWPGCPNYDDIAPHNRVPFQTREEAERAGYRPARNCP
jgi:endonuclease YncB( thermonuclease family)